MDKLKIKKYGCCFLIRGFNRTLICDLQYGNIHFIPNDLQVLLELHDGKTLEELYQVYNNEENETIDEYIEFLVKNNYLFLTSEPERFPQMEKQWDFPGFISNLLIDIHPKKKLLMKDKIPLFDQLGIIALQIRFTDSISIEDLNYYLELFSKSRIKSIELVIKYDDYVNQPNFSALLKSHLRVNYVIIYSSPINKKYSEDYHSIFFSEENMQEMTSAVPRSLSHFAINKEIFMEAQFHNTYFNRKLYLDEDLNIRNAPETETVGNLLNTDLRKLISLNNFIENWNTKKDDIRVCKDCEFRYFCVDSRIPLYDDKIKEFYFDSDCNYDPYTNSWQNL